jgi:hypothetical protein
MPRRAPILAALLAAATCLALSADPPTPGSHAAAFSDDGLVKADVSTLKDTQLVAHPDAPIPKDTNVIWCGTLQLAWNEAINLVGEKLQFVNQPPVVDLLNREDFTRKDLNPDCYVALADFERNHVENEIRAALEKVFHGNASPELIPPTPDHPGPYDFVAYAYLFKNLQFPLVFAENDPIYFGAGDGTQVKSFGFMEQKEKLKPGVFKQVSIFDYQGPDDFVIKLKTDDPQDQLVLAKVTPGATLQATIATVLKRMNSGAGIPAKERDKLSIPKLNYDLRTDFPELEGLHLKPGPNTPTKELVISKAEQLVRFQLNEKGAVLKSEAVMVVTDSAIAIPLDTHEMIFDKPFLILMKRADSAQPYFAMWVGNASLLVPAK